ncbi:hypothetical protein [Algicella marina]|uniref:Uncharacterized protein n=1 Tax=Algicella marina TaxID=2683284 RepID=A0A6P1SWF4_9RHOB|nr:hypothetical protein [Algicella marina]QHQ35004.1 hypothetical protein GO499_07250 [Algicella marina]
MDDVKTLKISYGDFNCQLEGFDNPFPIMRKVVNFFEARKGDPDFAQGDLSDAVNELVNVIARVSGANEVDAARITTGLALRNLDVLPPIAPGEFDIDNVEASSAEVTEETDRHSPPGLDSGDEEVEQLAADDQALPPAADTDEALAEALEEPAFDTSSSDVFDSIEESESVSEELIDTVEDEDPTASSFASAVADDEDEDDDIDLSGYDFSADDDEASATSIEAELDAQAEEVTEEEKVAAVHAHSEDQDESIETEPALDTFDTDEFILSRSDQVEDPEVEKEDEEPLVLGNALANEEADSPLLLDGAMTSRLPPNADPDLLPDPEEAEAEASEEEAMPLTLSAAEKVPSDASQASGDGNFMNRTLGSLRGSRAKGESSPSDEPADAPESAKPRSGLAGLKMPKLGRKAEEPKGAPQPLSVVSTDEAPKEPIEQSVAARQEENALRRLRIIRNPEDAAADTPPQEQADEPATKPAPAQLEPAPEPAAKKPAAARAAADNEIANKLHASFTAAASGSTKVAIEFDADEFDDDGEDMSPRRYAHLMGASALPDLMETAAAYLMLIEGESAFSRNQIMQIVDKIGDDTKFSAEAKIKSFGKLMRGSRLTRADDGRFVLSAQAMQSFIEKMDAYDEAEENA